jgi:hypothetical protein
MNVKPKNVTIRERPLITIFHPIICVNSYCQQGGE